MIILPIKKKWFDMIKTGEKTEEYREIKPYYNSRFEIFKRCSHVLVKFRNGYSSNSPYIVCRCSLSVGKGKKEWGAPDKDVYILTITRIYRLEQYLLEGKL